MTTGDTTAKVIVRDVDKVFDVRGRRHFQALRNIDLDVRDNEFLCIVGPSGCGKSTLLRMLGDLDTPSSGQVRIRRDSTARPLSAMIFQEESVFPWMTVAQNAAYGLKITRTWRGRQSEERIDDLLGKTGLSAFRSFYPHQLSGGMKQRLSLVRAWATNPELLLMDEPFAALDEQNKALLQQELVKLWEAFRSTVVFITHSLEEAVLLGDRVAVMTSAPGRIKETLDVPFPRPRVVTSLRRSGEFNQLVTQLWDSLGDEVERARSAEMQKLTRRRDVMPADAIG
ncbi:ABC transporter ATP-binding protein [Reyranella sp. CPCC 100927]|uniref:ABC transporter ATP-binding protein n=1 Tax=Reyranella sp. CPCC 100927 TaxID=2599616 RepID=UPI0011B3F152|nr:ABC transporter ATP-binding protein [Reyranella sp. CPCC 100927]TWS97609.1 ABC transporter ATP-binding protein [Reyranella sp. CPCC 100927]